VQSLGYRLSRTHLALEMFHRLVDIVFAEPLNSKENIVWARMCACVRVRVCACVCVCVCVCAPKVFMEGIYSLYLLELI